MDITYSVKRSSKRTKITITVERDREVVVHAPSHATDEAIARIVEAKRHWIYEKTRHSRKYAERPHPPGKELVNGESALYLGRNYRIEIVDEETECIRFDQRFLMPASSVLHRQGAMREWYVAQAKKRILPRVAKQARELGVSFGQARIVDNRYRWGSCTVRNNINLNWRLIKAPIFAIDYVIAHELAHLLEPNHTPRFWNIVKTQVPNMDRARDWLKENGQLLEEEV
ncbi:M48 family metallopeptidase [Candidatus Saccharibacteria bacterium]|nr:M48 family metallopeptidase [Gammaproteobacteria bacterium]MYB39992.1 M48 family metallopeptidase [Candidatus Saccharibacteria bacterium]